MIKGKRDIFRGNGKHILSYESGDIYAGEFCDGIRHGFGKLQTKDKIIYQGHFTNNKKNGFGKIFYPTGEKYFGSFIDDMKDGEGYFFDKNGNIKSQIWQNGILIENVIEYKISN